MLILEDFTIVDYGFVEFGFLVVELERCEKLGFGDLTSYEGERQHFEALRYIYFLLFTIINLIFKMSQ